MDKDRQIRFLYPPFFFLASLLFGLHLDPLKSLSSLLPKIESVDLVTTLIGGGVAVLVLGFLIGTITINILRLGFLIYRCRHYEVVLSDRTFERIRQQVINDFPSLNRNQRFCSVVTFDHQLLSKGVHEWLMRRWSAFYISMNSIIALNLALIAGSLLKIAVGPTWIIVTAVASTLLGVHAIFAWTETMNMIDFQSHIDQSKHSQRKNDMSQRDDDNN